MDAEDQFTYYVTEIKSKSTKIMSKHGVVWSKKELDTPAMKFIFGAADAAIKLERMFEHLTELLKRTLGLLISQEHAEIFRVLMEAHYAEDWPQVEFTQLMVFLMHRAAIGWWRAVMVWWRLGGALFSGLLGQKIRAGNIKTKIRAGNKIRGAQPLEKIMGLCSLCRKVMFS